MKKIVTALIIVLPFVLLIALFTVTGIARISANIPASGITINNKGDGVFFLDMADYDDALCEADLGVEVTPSIASNKEYTLAITDAVGNETDIVSRDENGAFRLHGVGIARLTYTSRDGGYSDSVLFNITSRGVLDFTPTLSDNGGNAYTLRKGDSTDFAVTLNSGRYRLFASCYPSALSGEDFKISTQNTQIVRLSDENGAFNAVFGGTTVIFMSMQGAHGTIEKSIAVTVLPSAKAIIDGMDMTGNDARLSVPLGATALTFAVQASTPLDPQNIGLFGADIDGDVDVRQVDGVQNAFTVTARLSSAHEVEISKKYTIELGGERYDFYVDFENRRISICTASNALGDGDLTVLVGKGSAVFVSCSPWSDAFEYSLTLDGGEDIELSLVDGRYVLNASDIGEATLRLSWRETAEDGSVIASGEETRRVVSVMGYSSLLFAENAESYGLGTLAIASKRYENSALVTNKYPVKLRAFGIDGSVATLDSSVKLELSDASLARLITDNGTPAIVALGTGEVTLTATWKYGDMFGVKPATLTFTAVDGVQVDDDASIRRAFKNKIPAVLGSDIYLGENLFDVDGYGARVPKYSDAVMREKLLEYTGEIPATFDWQYYENIGHGQPTVRYCLDITANLYGNGHTVSAQYITDMLDSTDNPYDFALFKGPLDFVATNTEGIKLASVKAQDNIVFLVRTDGVVIDNAVLKGCDDSTMYDDGEINLSLLNSIGTALEIMSDAQILRSRIMNGRTAVRVFGRDGVTKDSTINAEKEKISVLIDGCIMQNAREFILKIGTNRVVRGSVENPAPSLFDRDGNEYTAYNSSACDGYIDDEYFVESYALTDVTLKDSILRTSGLFTVGLESHFSGPMLANSQGAIINLDGWHNLTATSYPAILHLVGNVVLADWKTISSVDSSTLIESNTTQSNLAFLALDIAEMLKAVKEFGGDKYKNLIKQQNGEQYAHGGIAFYGGGKNYSVLDTSAYTFEKMNNYEINLSILTNSGNSIVSSQGWMLPLAAGKEDFRFVIFDATSSFDLDAQSKI